MNFEEHIPCFSFEFYAIMESYLHFCLQEFCELCLKYHHGSLQWMFSPSTHVARNNNIYLEQPNTIRSE